MTISGSTNFDSTAQEIITDAYAAINVYGADETVSAEDSALAKRILNRMIKAWQGQGLHLWKKGTAYVFLQKDQSQYDLYSTGDHATLSYGDTTLSADEAVGQTTLSVTSSSGMTAGDYIAIENDDNEYQWTTIASVPTSTTVTVNDALTTAASEDAVVIYYTTRLDAPFNVLSVDRMYISDDTDLPLNYLSYQQYFELPNKTTSAPCVSYNYNRQKDYSRITVWPVPDTVKYLLKITFTSKINDIDSVSNTSDFPQEWLEALVNNLAVRLAPSFGKAATNNFMELKSQAQESLSLAMSFDNEMGSLFLQPDYEGSGGFGRS